MSDISKTLSFICVGGLLTGLAVLTWFLTQPAKTTGFEKIGQEFFEDFTGSDQASSLEVVAIDPKSTNRKEFRVEEKKGVWTIPSHFGYQAEASDRLATTASSLIGLTRESLVGRLKKDHERFGVVDPLDEDAADPDAAGKRITIRDEDGDALVDLIIGRKADDPDATNTELAFGQMETKPSYYVRRPDEDQTYKVALDLELSTKFSDWIRPDLLNLDDAALRRISIDNYELIEQDDPLGRVTRLYKKQGDQLTFTRDTGFGPWNMAELAEEKKLDSAKLDTAVATLDDLRIVGVRKKTSYNDQQVLNADLTLNQIEDLQQNPQQFRQVLLQLQQELSDYGFNLTPVAPNSPELALIANFGELIAGTDEGVVYTLQFGNAVSGDENEIEIGSPETEASETESIDPTVADASTTDEQQIAADSAANADDPASELATQIEAVADSEKEAENRYLMIRVALDESLLGEKPVAPVEPVEPQKPEGYVPASEDEQTPGQDAANQDDDLAPSPDQADEAPSAPDAVGEGDAAANEPPQKVADDRPLEFQEYDLAKLEFDTKKTEYELKLSQYEDASKAFEAKVETATQRVKELNERFGPWFYVIAADNLNSLQLKRDDLISDREPVVPPNGAIQGLPNRPNINVDDVIPAVPVDVDATTSEESGTEPSNPSDPPADDGTRR